MGALYSREELADYVRRARFDPNFCRPVLRDSGEAEAASSWLANCTAKAKKRDMQSLDRALHRGAYPGASVVSEVIHQKDYIEEILEKYGEDDPEVNDVLARHDVADILEAAEMLEWVEGLPAEVKQRACGLVDFWESEGVQLDAFDWLEMAVRVDAGEEVADVLQTYGYQIVDEESDQECGYVDADEDDFEEDDDDLNDDDDPDVEIWEIEY